MNPNFKVIIAGLLLGMSGIVCAQEQDRAPRPDEGAAEAPQQEAESGDKYELSRAEKLLWMEDHLSNITEPTEVRYEFLKEGSYEDGFSDQVIMDVIGIHKDGSRSVKLQFFSGHREIKSIMPHQVTEIYGNPVLGIYMQGDTYEMDRLTGGNWRYFHRRIKLALSETAKVEDVKIEHDGRELEATRVTLAPYVKDPHRPEFDQFADKTYEFIFSDAIPGELYQIKTLIPNNIEPGAAPLIKETLTYAGSSPIDPESLRAGGEKAEEAE